MNRRSAALVAAFFLLICASKGAAALGPQQNTRTERFIDSAIQNRLVQVTFCGLAVSSGLSVVMAIKSLVGQDLWISVRSGTFLRSNDSSAQSMVLHQVEAEYAGPSPGELQDITRDCWDAAERLDKAREEDDQRALGYWNSTDSISLPAYSVKVYALSGYCLDFEKDNPSTRTTFALAPAWNENTVRLFAYLGRHSDDFAEVAIQLANWAVNGNLSASEIKQEFPFEEDDRRNACRLLNLSGVGANTYRLCAQ